jgi:hypothetical protein
LRSAKRVFEPETNAPDSSINEKACWTALLIRLEPTLALEARVRQAHSMARAGNFVNSPNDVEHSEKPRQVAFLSISDESKSVREPEDRDNALLLTFWAVVLQNWEIEHTQFLCSPKRLGTESGFFGAVP